MSQKVLSKLLVVFIICTLFSVRTGNITVEAAEIILDNSDTTGITKVGTWTSSTYNTGYYGTNYEQDGNTGQGTKYVQYSPTLSASGYYEVYAMWTSATNRASNVPIDIFHDSIMDSVMVDQRYNGGTWYVLGTYYFAAGSNNYVRIKNNGTDGYVIADAIRFVSVSAPSFSHPGILQSQTELDFMKNTVNGTASHPMKTGYTKMCNAGEASLSYIYQAYPVVHVEPAGANEEESHLRSDAHAAYAHALQWVITGDAAYKNKAIEIMNSWANTCINIVCDSYVQQPTLEASWALPIWVNAAEIICYYNGGSAGWSTTDINKFKGFVAMMRSKVDGSCATAPNWRASRALARMAAGVFLGSPTIYNQGYAEADEQIGLIGSDGLPSENTRDFVHCQYNVIATSQAAEIAYHQGNSGLYSKRLEGETTSVKALLARQSEYFVREMMGNVPTGGIDYSSENKHNPPYDMVLSRYKYTFSKTMTYTEQFVTTYNRPVDITEAHFVGWTTLTHAQLNQ